MKPNKNNLFYVANLVDDSRVNDKGVPKRVGFLFFATDSVEICSFGNIDPRKGLGGEGGDKDMQISKKLVNGLVGLNAIEMGYILSQKEFGGEITVADKDGNSLGTAHIDTVESKTFGVRPTLKVENINVPVASIFDANGNVKEYCSQLYVPKKVDKVPKAKQQIQKYPYEVFIETAKAFKKGYGANCRIVAVDLTNNICSLASNDNTFNANIPDVIYQILNGYLVVKNPSELSGWRGFSHN